MASSFSTDTKLELIATGEKAGLWGTITNTNLQILEQSATGYLSQSMASGDVTLTLTNGATSDGKNAFYELTGTLTGNRTLIMLAVQKILLAKTLQLEVAVLHFSLYPCKQLVELAYLYQ